MIDITLTNRTLPLMHKFKVQSRSFNKKRNRLHLKKKIALANMDREEDVKVLCEWLEKQPHLPKLNEKWVYLFLQSCYYSSERAKEAIDTFYTIKTHSPEIFGVRDTRNEIIQETARVGLYAVLPKLTNESYKIIYCKITDADPAKYIQANQVNLFDMVITLEFLLNGTSEGHIFVIDMQNVVFGHMARINLMVMKKFFMYLQEGLPVRLKAFCFINAVSFMDKIMTLIKPFMKKELLQMLYIYSRSADLSEFYKMVPKDCLPSDLGGKAESCQILLQKQLLMLEKYRDFLLEDHKLMVDESQRPGKPKSSAELFGAEGTFKKLDLD